ncbi:MAG: hypothetical protein A3J24_09345 [Deltaproteobacteria bacterium RIFCSPLOWO2_02_FULL_53_8]|nr:MAG: hypothetical protein A3J24_09345 [Deltaproteobacteria bacterium RIFCSPLOWO2_02_FULL_53_8]
MDNNRLLSFKDAITAKTGLRIHSHDNESLATHINLRTSQLALNSLDDYYNLIVSDTREGRLELKRLVPVLTVGESYFFRDQGQFKLLKDVVLTELIQRKSMKRELRVLSAGCSTGEEPYSLAILLDMALPDRNDWKISVVGTDIRDDLLEKARKGVYGEWSFRQVDEAIKKRYFRKKGANLAIDERIKSMVSFCALDIMEGDLPDYSKELYDFDLILCRNVFVYYNRHAVAKMLDRLTAALCAGGYLMTAHGELFSLPLGLLKTRIFAESVLYEKTVVTHEAARTGPRVIDEVKSITAMTPLVVSRPAAVAALMPLACPERSAEDVKECQRLFSMGGYASVIEIAQRLLKTCPNDYRMLYLCGAAYANLGELEKAKAHLQRASAVDTLAHEPYYLLALIAEEEGEHEKAKTALNKAIYLKKDFVAAYIELASMYEHEGVAKKAEKFCKAALDVIGALPKDGLVDMYENVTAGELAVYLKKTFEV